MSKAHLIFKKLYNSYSVYVKNLEKLTVPEIRLLEDFVKERNGILQIIINSYQNTNNSL